MTPGGQAGPARGPGLLQRAPGSAFTQDSSSPARPSPRSDLRGTAAENLDRFAGSGFTSMARTFGVQADAIHAQEHLLPVGVDAASVDELHGERAQRTGTFNRNHGHGHGQHLLSADREGVCVQRHTSAPPCSQVHSALLRIPWGAALDGAGNGSRRPSDGSLGWVQGRCETPTGGRTAPRRHWPLPRHLRHV